MAPRLKVYRGEAKIRSRPNSSGFLCRLTRCGYSATTLVLVMARSNGFVSLIAALAS
jgi:hypothetical protein